MSTNKAPEPAPLVSPEVHNDLKAAVGARHELGPEMEDHVLDAFLARIENKIDARVNDAISHLPATAAKKSSGSGGGANFAAVVAPSLALAIPLVAIAGGTAGAWAVFAVMGSVLLINFMYFIYEMVGQSYKSR